jgi:hypothetical protein
MHSEIRPIELRFHHAINVSIHLDDQGGIRKIQIRALAGPPLSDGKTKTIGKGNVALLHAVRHSQAAFISARVVRAAFTDSSMSASV